MKLEALAQVQALVGGWKTDSVFRRYNIVDEHDLDEAAAALDRRREKSQLGHNSTVVELSPEDKGHTVQ